tara:strand:- start:4568 stop:5401 length:834 start_codon:yes stop_codon:yes gene_type:complete
MATIDCFNVLPIGREEYLENHPIFRPAEEWKFKFHSWYWEVWDIFQPGGLDLFKNIAYCYPIEDVNNQDKAHDHNPFQVHHLPFWITQPLCEEVRAFVIKEHFKQGRDLEFIDERLSEWGNIYWKDDCRPVCHSRIPHVDFPVDEGWIGNLWLSKHDEGETSTNIYQFQGAIDEGRFDFQLDPRHHRYTEWHEWVGDGRNHIKQWENLSTREAIHWGFIKKASAPCEYGTMTIYNGNIPHCPYIADSVKWRWSHCFGFKYKSLARVFKSPALGQQPY